MHDPVAVQEVDSVQDLPYDLLEKEERKKII